MGSGFLRAVISTVRPDQHIISLDPVSLLYSKPRGSYCQQVNIRLRCDKMKGSGFTGVFLPLFLLLFFLKKKKDLVRLARAGL